MSSKNSALLVMAKMAQMDGEVSPEELELLGEAAELEEVLAQAQRASLSELVAGVDAYADRFFVAFQAANMAAVDGRWDPAESQLYQELLELLQLRPEDVELIAESLRQLEAIEPSPPDPRIHSLFEQSSFS